MKDVFISSCPARFDSPAQTSSKKLAGSATAGGRQAQGRGPWLLRWGPARRVCSSCRGLFPGKAIYFDVSKGYLWTLSFQEVLLMKLKGQSPIIIPGQWQVPPIQAGVRTVLLGAGVIKSQLAALLKGPDSSLSQMHVIFFNQGSFCIRIVFHSLWNTTRSLLGL